MENSDVPLRKKVPRPTPVYVITEDDRNCLITFSKRWRYVILITLLLILCATLFVLLLVIIQADNRESFMSALKDGRNSSTILLIGGTSDKIENNEYLLSKTIQLYDPNNPSENRIFGPDLEIGRQRPVVGLIGDIIIVAGGSNNGPLKSTELFEPDEDEWISKAEMHEKREMAFGASIGNRLYVCGGKNDQIRLNSCEYYDINANQWITVSSMPGSRIWAAAAAFGKYLYVMGGIGGVEKKGYLSSVLRYDTVSDSWLKVASMKTPRHNLAATAIGRNIFACGGITEDEILATNVCEKYDIDADTWFSMPNMTSKRTRGGLVNFKDRLYALGGWGYGGLTQDVEYFDEKQKKWTIVEKLVEARMSFGAVVY